jgi:hypothetical protein
MAGGTEFADKNAIGHIELNANSDIDVKVAGAAYRHCRSCANGCAHATTLGRRESGVNAADAAL